MSRRLLAAAPLPSRRQVLRGAGASLSLPFLASASPRAAWGATPKAPLRLVVAVIPNGMYSPWFFPAQAGAGYDLPALLAPLAPIQPRVSVLSGIHNWSGLNLAGHPEALGTLLTDTAYVPYCSPNGVSFDQVAANTVGLATPFHSLQVGVKNTSRGLPDACMDKLSWSADGSGLPPIDDPLTLYERVFLSDLGEPIEEALRISILDRVLDRTQSLRKRLNSADQVLLDQYETGLRELETRLVKPPVVTCDHAPPATATTVDVTTPVQYDLVATILRCDLTRIVTFLQGPTATNEIYTWLGATHGLHELSHNAYWDDELRDQYAATGVWHVERFVDFLTQLAATVDVDGTDLLSNTVCVLMTEFAESNLHQSYGPPYSLPILVAGGENAGIVQGQHRVYADESTGNFYLGLMHHLGIEADSFGDFGSAPLLLS
jgi:Protein of unknown function (DUF1552)